MTSQFLIDDDLTSDPRQIANGFNDFFADIGQNLANQISTSDIDPLTYLDTDSDQTIFLNPTDEEEVSSIIRTLKNSSPGWDSISSVVIKASFPSFLTPLTHLLNLSLNQGIVPKELKIAKVTPIFKSGDQTLFSNYRPISILPSFSKVLEKLVQSRLTSFLEASNLLHPYQFGFREKRNTTTALISITDKILQAFNNKKSLIGLFIDFRKAFDCVNHQILLKKLHKYGIRGIAANWIQSYLSDRRQYTTFHQTDSDQRQLTYGVPQGSILGPLLFLLYVNDLPKASNILSTYLYADDANCFIQTEDIQTGLMTLQSEITNITNWTTANKLTINTEKTHFVIFSLKLNQPNTQPLLLMQNHPLEQKPTTKFLGITLDSKLTFKNHIDSIRTKIAKSIGILCKAKRKLPNTVLKNLYHTFISPYLSYGIEVWGATCATYLSPLVRLQKKAVRIISHATFFAHTRDLFTTHEILPLITLYIKQVLIFVFKFVNFMLPPFVFENFFTPIRHSYQSRSISQNLLSVPYVRVNSVKSSIRSRGVHLWNLLHPLLNFHTCTSLSILKKRLHSHLLHNNVQLSS